MSAHQKRDIVVGRRVEGRARPCGRRVGTHRDTVSDRTRKRCEGAPADVLDDAGDVLVSVE
jgi:predicted PP-loop superfamily ATPase